MKQVNHSLIGSTEPVCPYCGIELTKMPSRKTKCKNCDNYFYLKTRAADRQKVIVTESQVVEIEKQWQIQRPIDSFNREYLAVKEDYDEIKKKLINLYGFEPHANDILLATYKNISLQHAELFNWGFYRNNLFKMSELLVRENKPKQAFDFFLEICYIDANGPRNCGKIDWELFKMFPPFNLKLSFLAPGILSRIAELAIELNISREKAKSDFLRIAKRIYSDLRILPLLPEDAWVKIDSEIVWIKNIND